MSLGLNILRLKKILNDYSGGKDVKNIEFNISLEEVDEIINYVINVNKDDNYFNIYELKFLSKISELANKELIKKSSNITNENILCLDNRLDILDNIYICKNIGVMIDNIVDVLMNKTIKLNRREVEYDINTLQIIPYMIVTHNNDIILLEKKKGDSRLINYIDFPAGHCNKDNIKDSIYTELNEELGIAKEYVKNIKYIDIIPPVNDKFSVSYYHLGLICNIELYNNCKIENKESDKHNILYYDDIKNDCERLKYLSGWCTYSLIKYLEYNLNERNDKLC